jgi:hypothetical protein
MLLKGMMSPPPTHPVSVPNSPVEEGDIFYLYLYMYFYPEDQSVGIFLSSNIPAVPIDVSMLTERAKKYMSSSLSPSPVIFPGMCIDNL